MHSHASVWPLELGIRTPMLWHGPLSWGHGLPRFVVALVGELGIWTPGWGNRVNRSTVFALHCFVLPCVLNMMQGVGLPDFTLGCPTIVYPTFLFPTLPCPILTYSS